MKVMVTGSRGLVGSAVLRRVKASGIEVVSYDLVDGLDVLNRDSLRDAARGCDAVIHVAALLGAESQEPDLVRRVNVEGTENVLAAAESGGVRRILYLSSLSVLGVFKGHRAPDYLPLDLDHPCYASTEYEVSKLEGERLCSEFAASGMGEVITLRVPGVWSRQTYDAIRVARDADATFEYEPYWEYGAFLDVRDLADACRLAIGVQLEGSVTLLLSSSDITTSGRTSREWVEALHPGLEWRGGAWFDRNHTGASCVSTRPVNSSGGSPGVPGERFWNPREGGGLKSLMSLQPWESDRHLTIDIAQSVINAAFPDIDVGDLDHLGSGWEFDAFLTADGWVFRFPRRQEAQELFEREAPILQLAQTHLGPEVAVPRVERLAEPCGAFPYRFAGHRCIPGAPADSIPPARHPILAAGIGAALGALHSIPLDAARSVGLAELDRAEEGRRIWFERGLANASRLLGYDSVVDQAVEWVRTVEDPLRRLDAPLRFIHHDLSPEHILAAPATGRLTGIIDWTDAILGDPARDFVILVAFGGWSFVEAVLEGYLPGIDSGFYGRLRFMARLLPVMWLGEAHARGEDCSKHIRWVRNTFSEGSGCPPRGERSAARNPDIVLAQEEE